MQVVRCSVCGLFVRPGDYGNQRHAVPGWHWPILNEDTLTAEESDCDCSMTLCEGSQEIGVVYSMEVTTCE
jgi:hypothetical protein